jgi:PAS domain S-box-containing protein
MTLPSVPEREREPSRPRPKPGRAIPLISADSSRRVDLQQVGPILPELIDSISDALVVLDRGLRVVAANRRYIEAFGISGAGLVGSSCHDSLNCPEQVSGGEGHRCAACEAIDSRQARRLLRTRPDAEGRPRRWEVSFNPVAGAGGEITHIVEVWRDISERSLLESQLAHSERLASLGLLAAGVGHEINNPLASMLAGVESLERWLGRGQFDADGVTEAAEVLALIETEARRCSETTRKLMLLAQPYQTAATKMDVNRAVLDTFSLLDYEMRRLNVQRVEDLDPDLPEIWARASGIRGVCMNLMMNAVQAMQQGGTLTVRTRREGGGVTIEITDTGPGIDPAHLDRIWDPFFTTKPVGQGTGLGLSISQRIITRHGGRIRVESRPGEGAGFILWLPESGPGGDGA